MLPNITISVVIPTYQRRDRLQLTLAALEQQTLAKDRFEVIVSDDGSGDGTVEQLTAYARTSAMEVVVVTGPNAGPSAARNRGLAKARGAWVAMTDDDCVPEADWLEKHLAFILEHPEVGGVGGKVVRYSDGVISRYVDWTGVMLPPVDRNGKAVYLVTANAVFRTDLIGRLGGFDEGFKWPGGEDPDLSYRAVAAGAVLLFNSGSVVRHMHRETVKGTYRMFWHHGLGAGAQAVLEGKSIRDTLKMSLKRKALANMKSAFAKQPVMEAFVFSYLEIVRAFGFIRGFDAQAQVARSGTTSSNG